MSLFDNIKRVFGVSEPVVERSAPPAESPVRPRPVVRAGGVAPWVVTGEGALAVSTVYRCVKLLSDSVAQLPLRMLRRNKDGIFMADTYGMMYNLLQVQPMETMSAFDFWRQVVQQLLLDGNAYIVPLRTLGSEDGISSLLLCGRGTVSHDTSADTYTVNDSVNGISGTFDEGSIIHIKGLTLDGKRGLSVLTYARMTLDIASTADRETLSRFANGGNVRGIVSNDTSVRGFGEYQDAELEKTATDIDERFRGGERIVSLPGQVQFSPLSLSSTDMQFLESRKFTVREICRFFGVHPTFVFDDTSNNYKSAEMANVAYLSMTLNPLLRQIEGELLRKLIRPQLWEVRRIEFDRRQLYACDLASRAQYQTATIAAGLYSVNDWRREENRPPVDGGDKVFVSANLKPLNEYEQSTSDNA